MRTAWLPEKKHKISPQLTACQVLFKPQSEAEAIEVIHVQSVHQIGEGTSFICVRYESQAVVAAEAESRANAVSNARTFLEIW